MNDFHQIPTKKATEKHLALARRQRRLYNIIVRRVSEHRPINVPGDDCEICRIWFESEKE